MNRNRKLLLNLCCGFLCGAGSVVAALNPVALRCEYRVNPLGIDEAQPRLTWRAESNERGQKQTDDFGIGAYVPAATNLTCYRFGEGGSERGACSYFAPLIRFGIKPGMVFDYHVYLAIGSSNEIRDEFRRLREARRRPGNELK